MADADACHLDEYLETTLFTLDEASSPISSVISLTGSAGSKELFFTANSNSKIKNYNTAAYDTCLRNCDASFATCANACSNDDYPCVLNCVSSDLRAACPCTEVLDCDLAALEIDECDIYYSYRTKM